MVRQLARDHAKIGYKLEKLEVKKTPGRIKFELQEQCLHEAIFSIVSQPTAYECRRT